jgi:hypothetical protein
MSSRVVLGFSHAAVLLAVTGALWAIHASAAWPRAEGRVLRSEVRQIYHRNPTRAVETHKRIEYQAVVEYEYHVAGVRHTSDRILATLPSIVAHEKEAADLVARFPAGAAVAVHYDPDDPTRTCLIPGSAFGRAGFAIIIVITLAAAILVVLVVLFFEGRLPFGRGAGEDVGELTG